MFCSIVTWAPGVKPSADKRLTNPCPASKPCRVASSPALSSLSRNRSTPASALLSVMSRSFTPVTTTSRPLSPPDQLPLVDGLISPLCILRRVCHISSPAILRLLRIVTITISIIHRCRLFVKPQIQEPGETTKRQPNASSVAITNRIDGPVPKRTWLYQWGRHPRLSEAGSAEESEKRFFASLRTTGQDQSAGVFEVARAPSRSLS